MSEFRITEPGEYVMRNGERFTVKCVDWPGACPIVGYANGHCSPQFRHANGKLMPCDGDTDIDIVDVHRPMIEREGWVVIWKDGQGFDVCSRNVFDTEEQAAHYRGDNKGFVAHITWKEPAE